MLSLQCAVRRRLSSKALHSVDVTKAHRPGPPIARRRKQATYEEFLIEESVTDGQREMFDAYPTYHGASGMRRNPRPKVHGRNTDGRETSKELERIERAKRAKPDRTSYTFRTMDLWDEVGNVGPHMCNCN